MLIFPGEAQVFSQEVYINKYAVTDTIYKFTNYKFVLEILQLIYRKIPIKESNISRRSEEESNIQKVISVIV